MKPDLVFKRQRPAAAPVPPHPGPPALRRRDAPLTVNGRPASLVRATAALLSVSALLAGCLNLAPAYQRPEAPVDTGWPMALPGLGPAVEGAPLQAEDRPAPEVQPPADAVGWQTFYSDPRLHELIAIAMANNRDLRSTALNIDRARALYGIARADQFPLIGATGSATGQRTVSGATTHLYSAVLGFSAFELDFFGRVRNLREQALETLLATEESRRAARISLVASVASAYLTLAADRQRLRLAEETLASQLKSFALTQRTFELGAASALDVAQAQTSVDSARADIAVYRTQVSQDLNALSLLVGARFDPALVADEDREVGSPLTALDVHVGPGPGLPSTVLMRRPDVLAAERSLRAANANIGAARATLFPSVSLTSSVGTASSELSDLFGHGAGVWSFIPSISVPLFNRGALSNSVRVAEVDRDLAVTSYERTIQTAFREVADALAQRRDIDDLLTARQSLVTANEKTFRLSDARYRRGADSYLAVLDAQRSYYTAQQNLISARLLEAGNLVTLYSVLGGGWQD